MTNKSLKRCWVGGKSKKDVSGFVFSLQNFFWEIVLLQ